MDLIALSRLGGRHLVTLHLLLDTQSVTRTAERLCTTPSPFRTNFWLPTWMIFCFNESRMVTFLPD